MSFPGKLVASRLEATRSAVLVETEASGALKALGYTPALGFQLQAPMTASTVSCTDSLGEGSTHRGVQLGLSMAVHCGLQSA